VAFGQFQAEVEQLHSFNSKISKDSKTQKVEKDELLKSKVSKITTIRSWKSGKNITDKERVKLSTPSKKRQPKVSPTLTRKNDNKVRFY